MNIQTLFFHVTRLGLFVLLINSPAAKLLAQPDRASDPNLELIKKFITYAPLQKNVEMDLPGEDDLKNCRLEKADSPAGYIVRDSGGRMLRKFLDTSGNKKLDHLSYYKNGVEVYREIDKTGNGKPQEFRWLGTAGTRWGIDLDGDGKIDEWKRISAEEVVSEAFEAIRAKDAKRFAALLLTTAEFKSLNLGEVLGQEIDARWQTANKDFAAFANAQREIDSTTQFINPTNGLASLVAAEAYGNKSDVLFYDHASAVYQKANKEYGNVAIGTIVYVSEGKWRLVELPEFVAAGKPLTNGGAFFPAMLPTAVAASGDMGVNKAIAEIHSELDAIDTKIKSETKALEITKLEQAKAGLLENLIYESEAGEQRTNTVMYAADSIVSAYQDDRFAEGLKFLDGLAQRLKGKKIEGVDYIRWRAITGKYNYANLKGNSEERDRAHERWLAELMEFQKEFPESKQAAEAICYLGVNYDNEGKEKEAIEWYRQAATRFANTSYGKRSKGALSRLNGQGEKLELIGEDTKGNKFNLQDAKWRDKVVVIHFWETWCTDGMDEIQRLAEKYKGDVVFVGCNIEASTEEFEAYMKKNPGYSAWTQLHAPGSIELSPLAQQLGVPSLPLVVIANKKGELAEPMVVFADLDRQIERQRRR